MAPKSAWTKRPTDNQNATQNVAVEPAGSTTINYGEVQADEIDVLRAIYMDDFEEVEVKSAWSTNADRSFKLILRSLSEQDAFVIMSVRLTATYPKTVPLLDLQGLDGYHERTQNRIRNIVNIRPKQLLGEVMIHTIANEIQEALEDAVQARQQGTLPSLEEERASAEEVAAAFAKQAEAAQVRMQQEANDEEERMLKHMVDEEVNRRDKRKPSRLMSGEISQANGDSQPEVITFDQPASIQVANESLSFDKVTIVGSLSGRKNKQVLLAKPHLGGSSPSRLVVVKRDTFQKSRSEALELESSLAPLTKLRHPGLMITYAYSINRVDDLKSELILCNEYADRGTLHEWLELSSLNVGKARQFTIELLEALEYLHHHGIAHGRLTAKDIGIVSSPSLNLKLANFGYSWLLRSQDNQPCNWPAPESGNTSPATLRKSDIWQLGEIVCRMFLGPGIVSKYSSPQLMMSRLDLSDSFNDFLRKAFTVDAKRRPSAFDLLTAEFLRTDDPVLEDTHNGPEKGSHEISRIHSGIAATPGKRRSRHDSSSLMEPMSRYANDFTELGRLGKGGFGEVVKARNKLDGGIYAVKKIKQAPQLLDQVISEVMLLNRLNHPYVVRYFSTWIEEDAGGSGFENSSTDTATATKTQTEDDASELEQMDFGYQSTGGLDFISSSGFPQIKFENDSDEEDSDDEDVADEEALRNGDAEVEFAETSNAQSLPLRKSRSDSKKAPSTLYIQMEYCERHTLRDLIRKSLTVDDCWRYVRQVTEGLAHIHGHGIIHRDLKPDNIFIDVASNPKIGDFGLATTAQQHFADRAVTMSGYSAGEMTRSVGTTLYVAPELRSASGQPYNDKVDMYSLGIIFYEMCEPFSTGMERINALQRVREKQHELPPAYQQYGAKAAQGKLIARLISHKPSERPSSTELLRSDMLPLKIEDETIRKALSGLSDPRSPYHQKVMSALFAHDTASESRVKALAWDARSPSATEDAIKLRLRGIARQTLETIFRRHGAEEARRQSIFPKSGYYNNANLVQVLDASGNLLQLPFDLVLPHARQLSRQQSEVRCTFSFGSAYRDAFDGGPPRISEEVDFDITNSEHSDIHTFNDAEAIKVLDEVVCEMPLFAASATASFHLNHSSILDAVLVFCRIARAQQPAVKEIVSRLGFHQHTWSKVRPELRKFGLPDTTLDDMYQFDFRDAPEKAFGRLRTLFSAANSQSRAMLDAGIRSLSDTVRMLSSLTVRRKVYITPLGSVNAKFYEDGLLFQCVLERKSNRIVIAAGGRYDSLIRAHRPPDARVKTQGCVGVSIGLDAIVMGMVRNNEGSSKKTFLKDSIGSEPTTKRCDVLLATGSSEETKAAGIKLLAMLWEHNISAELAASQSGRSKDHRFIVTLRHAGSNTVKVMTADNDGEEVDVAVSSLVSHLQQELREVHSTRLRQPPLLRQASQPETERKGNVQVLLAARGSKKSNKYQIVSDAQEQWSRKLEAAKTASILAVETRDDVLDLIQQTRLSDVESWRKAVQGVQLNDRQYVQQIHEMLLSWRREWEDGAGAREACVFNFRTQRCVYYDLGL